MIKNRAKQYKECVELQKLNLIGHFYSILSVEESFTGEGLGFSWCQSCCMQQRHKTEGRRIVVVLQDIVVVVLHTVKNWFLDWIRRIELPKNFFALNHCDEIIMRISSIGMVLAHRKFSIYPPQILTVCKKMHLSACF